MRRVIVADDDSTVAGAVADLLDSCGYEACIAHDGVDLVARLAREGPFDVVVTDLEMRWPPEIEVLDQAHGLGIRTPVVFISGISDPFLEDRVAALGHGAVLLRKPFEADALVEAVGLAIADA
jgi:FixJ family two-component response regulator